MSSLSGREGPRYKHQASDTGPYETIAVEKLTPIVGAEISGVDVARLVSDDSPNRQMDEIHRALAENLVIFFRDQHTHAGAASGLRSPFRRAAHPSRRTA
jgi:taurine dioxygenase